MANQYDEVFSPRTVADLRRAIHNKLARKALRGLTAEDIEDAVSDAVLAVLEYWIPKHATDDKARNFNYAAKFGASRAVEWLAGRAQEWSRSVSLDEIEEDGELLWARPSYSLPHSEERAACELYKSLPARDRRVIVDPLLAGVSVREQACRAHTYRTAVERQRKNYVQFLRAEAPKFGLV